MLRFKKIGGGLLIITCLVLVWFSCDREDDNESDDGYEEFWDDDDWHNPDSGRCSSYNENGNLYFGDLHAHTGLSFDAFGYHVRATPAQALAFAKGAPMLLPPLDENGKGTRTVRLDRPLDFAAITDHVEYLGEVALCNDPESPAYEQPICQELRTGGSSSVTQFGIRLANKDPKRISEICGLEGVDCLQAAADVWAEVVAAAEDATDSTRDCSFTAFPAYEYTGSPHVSNLHRNILFKNTRVPQTPLTYFEHPTPESLWDALNTACNVAGGDCDFISIPHNSNWSNGRLLRAVYPGTSTLSEELDYANQRRTYEPLVEIMQHKGDMECKNGFPGIEDDPLCDFEKYRAAEFNDCEEGMGYGGVNALGCVSKYDFIRNVFLVGLEEYNRIGLNPFRIGVIGSTDTHNAIPGMVDEKDYPGHVGIVDADPLDNLSTGTITHTPIASNPGGLVGVWARENTPDELFATFRRNEVYSTSGPRIKVRLWGGPDVSDFTCDLNFVNYNYPREVPMGGLLRGSEMAQEMQIYVVAFADTESERQHWAGIQKIQIIKGWISTDGQRMERIYDITEPSDINATVDPLTCELSGKQKDRLCASWTDPDFDPAVPAFYYVRVLENPSCRWNTYLCNDLPADQRPETCDDPNVPKIIQERAITSPIWYEP